MYLKKRTNKDGDIYLSIMEKYYDSNAKKTRERTVKAIGYVSELATQYPDPIAHFKTVAEDMTFKKKEERTQIITIDTNAKLDIDTNDTKNVGYGILKKLYLELELKKFWNWKTCKRKMNFNIDQVFRLLTISRALYPGSKLYTLNNKDKFFEPFGNISRNDIYNSLDIIAENKDALQEWIFKQSKKICARDLSVSYFDCTNYYFDIGQPDIDVLNDNGEPIDKDGNVIPAKYRKRGPEKNHRPDPIVEMGLLMDKNGIPIAYDLFPGNESEKLHMRPIIKRVKNEFEDTRIIFVADRGLNTSDNIYWINGDNKGKKNNRDGYVYGQSIRGADKEFKSWVLKNDYHRDKVIDDNGEEIIFTHKSRIFPKKIQVNVTKPGQKKPVKKVVVIDQKQMVYYSDKYAAKQKLERANMIERAKDLIKYPQKYTRVTASGSASYVCNIAFDKNTGEIVNGKCLSLNTAKILEEEKYDGYYSVVTSELNMSDFEIRKVYSGLAKIEDSFKVTKTYFESQPVFVRTNEHIDAHFATCFLALVLMRLLEMKLEHKYPTGKILDAIRNYNCTKIDVNMWQFTFNNEIINACSKLFDMNLEIKYRTQQEIQRLLKY